MDDVAVLADSKGGNTAKIARAIAEELGVAPAPTGPPVPGAGLLIIGSGTYSNHTPGNDMMRFIRDGYFSGRRVALFGTASYENDGNSMIGIMADALEQKGAEIVSTAGGRGRLFVLRNGRVHPDDLGGARAFARELAGKIPGGPAMTDPAHG